MAEMIPVGYMIHEGDLVAQISRLGDDIWQVYVGPNDRLSRAIPGHIRDLLHPVDHIEGLAEAERVARHLLAGVSEIVEQDKRNRAEMDELVARAKAHLEAAT